MGIQLIYCLVNYTNILPVFELTDSSLVHHMNYY